jgi:2-haloacid dehalogenase
MTIKIDANGYDAITFDCYGTLIDWEAGLMSYIQPLLQGPRRARRCGLSARFLRTHREQAPDGSLSSVSADSHGVLSALGERLGFHPSAARVGRLSGQYRRLDAVSGYGPLH